MISQQEYQFYVTAPGERPHYWLFEAFVWAGDGILDFDTDGDAEPFDSTTWTCLMIATRPGSKERFYIVPVQDAPLLLKVTSEQMHIAARAAYALAVYTGGTVSETADGTFTTPYVLIPHMGAGFDVSAALSQCEWLKPPQKPS